MDLGLRGRVAIVSGSSKGMGKEIALSLALEGVNVVLCSREEIVLRKSEIDIARETSQHNVLAVPADMSKPDDIRRVVRGAYNRFGRLDIVVNNIGDWFNGSPSEVEDEELTDIFQRNFFSVVRMCREVIPYMRQQQWGRIINRLSISVKEVSNTSTLSNAGDMAVVAYSKTLARSLASSHITVNNVFPGYIATEGLSESYRAKASLTDSTSEDFLSDIVQKIPVGRLGQPKEVGSLVCFLASEHAAYITGTNVVIDGGHSKATL